MGLNNFYKKKRREEKAQRFADSMIKMSNEYNDALKADATSLMIFGAHYAYKVLYKRFIKPYEDTADPEIKCQLLCDLAKEISDKHKSTMAEAKAYCEKVGVQYDE